MTALGEVGERVLAKPAVRVRAVVRRATRAQNVATVCSLARRSRDYLMNSNPKTAADERFEAYLDDHGVTYSYEPDWAGLFGIDVVDNPDFLVDPDEAQIICEVKQFETRRITDRLLKAGGVATLSDQEVFGAIRSKLTGAARGQLRAFAELRVPLVIVLANPLNADVHLDFWHVAHAILGNPKVQVPIGPDAPPNLPVTEKAEDYGAFISIQPTGEIVNHHPFVSAVVVIHERQLRQDAIEGALADEPDVKEFEDSGAAMLHYAQLGRRLEAARSLPAGSYRWVDVYDLSGNPTAPGFTGTPLPQRIFNGPRDRWYGFADGEFKEVAGSRRLDAGWEG
jgi:hypothetical protein